MKFPFPPFRGRFRPEPAADGRQALSLLSPDDVRSLGALPYLAICGWFDGEERSAASFRPNPAFVDFMHRVIAAAGPSDPGLAAAARTQERGYVYVIDLRTPNSVHGNVPPEDIVGAFKVEEGRIAESGYSAFDCYRLFTRNGAVRLPRNLHEALIAALMSKGTQEAGSLSDNPCTSSE